MKTVKIFTLVLTVISITVTGRCRSTDVKELQKPEYYRLLAINAEKSALMQNVSLSFRNDGISGKAACNQYSGEVSVSDNTIEIYELINTQMACRSELMKLENRYLTLLRKVESYENNENLQLKTPAGDVLTFEPVAPEKDVALQGTRFKLETFLDKETASSTLAGPMLHMKFSENRIEGFDGCFDFVADYSAENGNIRITGISTQGSQCSDSSLAEQQGRFYNLLKNSQTYSIDGSSLLLNADQKGLEFRAISLNDGP